MTGELRLTKPTVPQEVFWGLHFFNETLFEAVPDLIEKVERVLAQYYPVRAMGRAPVLPVRVVDRRRSRRQSVRHQRRHPEHAAGEPAYRAAAVPAPAGRLDPDAEHHRDGRSRSRTYRQALEKELAATGEAEDIANAEPGRSLPAVPLVHAPPSRRDDQCHRAGGHPGRSDRVRLRRHPGRPTSSSSRPSWSDVPSGNRCRDRASRCGGRSSRSASAPSGSTSGRTRPSSTRRSRDAVAGDLGAGAGDPAAAESRGGAPWLTAELARPLPRSAGSRAAAGHRRRRSACSAWCDSSGRRSTARRSAPSSSA